MAGIIYSARELRDGHLSVTDVQAIGALIHLRNWDVAVQQLVAARRWEAPEHISGWYIHDYLEFQPSREAVLRQRDEDRARKRRGAQTTNSQRIPAGTPPDSENLPGAPGPGPGPGPGFPTGIPGAPPNPPRKRRGRNSSETLEFENDGPKYEQRQDANGKREWVVVP